MERKIADRIEAEDVLEEEKENIFTRNIVLKKASLLHNQLSSPLYRDLWLYSWHAAGYEDNRPGIFPNPNKFLSNVGITTCLFPNCQKHS